MTVPGGDLDPDPGNEVAVLLVSAHWSTPARPAATVLRELARRWGSSVLSLLLEDADEDILDQLGIETIPTWLRLTRRSTQGSTVGHAMTQVRDLSATDVLGNEVVLSGTWQITDRRSGAMPKHMVAELFGPPTGSAT